VVANRQARPQTRMRGVDRKWPKWGKTTVRGKTRGQVEAEISEAIIKFEKEFLGRGPTETKTYIIDDLVLVRLRGIMTPAEQQLVQAENTSQGRELIKQVRHELLERGRPLLEALIQNLLGRKTVSLHTDLSTITGERVMIFTLDAAPDL
jgi:uncharacterized protein YbcI